MPATFRARSLQAGLAVLAVLALAVPASAALYKWTDANGRTVYSDQPPPPNVKSEVIGGAPPPANPDAVKDMANREAEFRKRQMDRTDDAKKTEKSRAEAQKLATFCTQARTQAAGLRRADIAMYRLNDKGERVELDEAGRRAEADKLEALMRERKCPPAPPG
jgi:hypothetical protein